jgi:exopolysaccharide production protein ExoY
MRSSRYSASERSTMSLGDTVTPQFPLPGWKRATDLIAAGLAFPLLALVTFAVAIIIGLTSRGPIFFRQQRIGYRGRVFLLYKFRTMHVGAEAQSHRAHMSTLLRSNGPMQKMDGRHDPRLIPGGWIIRACGLDELPQILNVFRGEMSIVGPRPCLGYEYEQYSAEQRTRCNAVPGLTGLWQVSGKNRTTFEMMIRLDIRYTEQKSFWLDLRIIALTIPVLVRQVVDTGLQRVRYGRRARPAPIRAG